MNLSRRGMPLARAVGFQIDFVMNDLKRLPGAALLQGGQEFGRQTILGPVLMDIQRYYTICVDESTHAAITSLYVL